LRPKRNHVPRIATSDVTTFRPMESVSFCSRMSRRCAAHRNCTSFQQWDEELKRIKESPAVPFFGSQ
jgi:hypothetical protein